MNKVDIFFFITSLHIGGAEKNLLILCREIKDDFRIAVCSIKKGGILKEEFEKIGIPVFEIGNSISKYKNLIEKLKPQIIHSFLPRACYISRIAKKKNDKYFLINSQRAVLQRTDIFEKYYEVMEKLTIKKADLIIANSESAKKRILDITNLNPEKIIVIYTGIDTEYFRRENFSSAFEKGNKFIIGTVGRLCSHKNYETLIRAIPEILKNIKNLKVVFIGEGEERKKLEKLSKKLNLNDFVKFLGEKKDVANFLKTFDIFVLPSISEGLPTALLESMSMEVPSIASDISPHREIIEHGKDGIIFKTKNYNDLAEKIIYLYKNKEKREILGLNARIKILEKFSFKNYIEEYKNLYLKILKNV